MRFKMNPDLMTGIDEIDNQHKRLFEMAAQLEENSDAVDSSSLVQALSDYAGEHFQTEEMYMKSFNYPKIEEHKTCHLEIKEQYRKFLLKMANTSLDTVRDEAKEITFGWIKEHCSTTDVEMATFIREHLKKLDAKN